MHLLILSMSLVRRFVGINLDQEIPDLTTFWRFNEALNAHNLDERIFELNNQQLQAKGLMVKEPLSMPRFCHPQGVPLSDKKREKLTEEPSPQIDTDATSPRNGGTYYFGYKGHIGVDVESKLIRKTTFTPVNIQP